MINRPVRPVWRPRQKKKRLRFTPTAWAKLLFLRDLGDCEVGGFGVSSPEDLLLVKDIRLIKQRCTLLSVKFDDQDVANYFEAMVDQGYPLEQFARIWIHTHPGDCPRPSAVDEETFERCFGGSDWATMCIIAQNDSTYARLRFCGGPGGNISLSTAVDFESSFGPSDERAWREEYEDHVTIEPTTRLTTCAEFEQLRGQVFFDLTDHGSLENHLREEVPWT